MKCYLILMVYFAILQINTANESKKKNDHKIIDNDFNSRSKIFIPTKEWQDIEPGQSIPRGLHVRINLETGRKEAKILDEDNSSTEQENDPSSHKPRHHSLTVVEGSTKEENLENLTDESLTHQKLREQIAEALKNIKSEDGKDVKELQKEAAERKNKFRSYDELKSEMADLHMKITMDADIMAKLIAEFKTDPVDQIKIDILTDLDYLLHQIDNAVDFTEMGGITSIILPSLNSTNREIRKGAMLLIGSASQSNPKVQIIFLEEGILSQLLRIVAIEKDSNLASRAVFALSCLVRGFPFGQRRMLESGGLEALRDVLRRRDWQLFPLQLKVVSLIRDLMEERIHAVGDRAVQLATVDLIGGLIEGEWCQAISSLLEAACFDKRGKRQDIGAALAKEFPLRPDHDMVDKVVGAMASLASKCQHQFESSLELLSDLESFYEDLAYKEKFQGEDGHELFGTLAQHLNYLVTFIRRKDEL